MAEDKGGTTKDIDIPYLVKGYPRPSPPSTKRQDIFDPEDFTDIDDRVVQTPDEKLKDFPTLVDHLTDQLSTDIQKVRAIFTWLGHQNVIDTKYPDVTDPYMPKAYLKTIQTHRSAYSKLFAILCREAKVPCVILEGSARTGVEDEQCGQTSWNAVYVEGGWRFVHCHWAFIYVVGKQPGGWLKLEENGKKLREEIQESEGTIKHKGSDKEGYFLVDPEVLIYFCRPKDKSWQLLKSPLTLKRFKALPYIKPLFAESNFSFRTGQEGTIKSIDGQCNVVIKSMKWNGQLKYELFYKQTPGREFPNTEGAERYVAMLNKNQKTGEFNFRVRFPIEGNYKLKLYRKKGSLFSGICDFKLICDERKARCDPLPETPEIGWGPGVTAKQEGIYDTSHDEGIIESRDGKNLEISFKVKDDQEITPRLKHASLLDNLCKKFFTSSIINNRVTIKLKPDDGEYALIIDAYKRGSESKNVLNYIIESGQPNRRREGLRENPTERAIRQQLKDATKEKKKDDLLTVIEKFKKLKMDDKGHLTKAKLALERLEIKENLKYALMKERTDEIEKAIRRAQESKIAQKVQPDVERAQAFLDDLLYRQTTPRALSAVNHRNVAELRAIRKLTVPQKKIFSAVFMLLGENKLDLQDSNYMLSLLKRTGEEGLLRRLKKFDPGNARPDVVAEAKKLLGNLQEDRIAQFCPPVRKLYQEGVTFVNNFHRATSPSIHNEPSSGVPAINVDETT